MRITLPPSASRHRDNRARLVDATERVLPVDVLDRAHVLFANDPALSEQWRRWLLDGQIPDEVNAGRMLARLGLEP